MTSEILIVVGYLLYDQIRRSLTWALPFNLVSIEVNQKSMRTLYTLLNSLLLLTLSSLLSPLSRISSILFSGFSYHSRCVILIISC